MLQPIDFGAVAILSGVIVILARAIESLARRGKHIDPPKPAGLTAEELRKALKETLVDTDPQRHEDLRKLMRDVVHDELERWDRK